MAGLQRYISSSGSDAADGLTTSTPWLSLANVSAVIAAMVDSNTLDVFIKEGETVDLASNIAISISRQVVINFTTYGGLNQGVRAYINWTGGNVTLFTITGDFTSVNNGISFSNLDINGNNTGYNVIETSGNARCYVSISNCRIHHLSQGQSGYVNKGRGLFMVNTTYACVGTVTNSRFEFIGNDAISLYGTNTVLVTYSTFKNIGDLSPGGGGEGDGITTHEASTVEVYDSHFTNCEQGGVYCINMSGTNKVVRCFFYNCLVGCVVQATSAYAGTGGKMLVSNCVLIQPDGVFQLDDFGNGETQYIYSAGSACAAMLGTTSAVNKDCTLKLYNCTLWSGTRGGTQWAVQIGDTNDSYLTFDMKNCVLITKESGSLQRGILLRINVLCLTISLNYNVYWSTRSSDFFRIQYGATATNGTLTNWQSSSAITGGTWKALDANSSFYSGASDNLTSSNIIYGLPPIGTPPPCITDLYLHPLNTAGKVGNTTGVDVLHTGLIATTTVDGRYQQFTTNAFYRGALGPLRVNQ